MTTTITLPTTAALIEQTKPNTAGQGVIQVHAVGCQHQRRVKADLVFEVDPTAEYLRFGAGVRGAVDYLIALRSGLLDDGVAHTEWIARLAPCAKA